MPSVVLRWRETVFGLLVALYCGVSVVAWSDYPRVAREEPLDDLERRGLGVWRRENCQTCHQLFGFGGFLGPDLTNAVDGTRDDVEFFALLSEGYGRMPALGLGEEDQAAVLAFLRAVGRTGRSQPEPLGAARAVAPAEHYLLLAEEWSRASGTPLDPAVRRGSELWVRGSCGVCHAAFTAGPRRAPDLSAGAVDRSVAALGELLAQGRGNMPSYVLAPGEVDDLAGWLEWIASRRAEMVELNDRMLGREPFTWGALPWFEYR